MPAFAFDPSRHGLTANGHPTGCTIAEAAAYLGISERHYHRLVGAGVLPSFPPGSVNLGVVFRDYAKYLGARIEALDEDGTPYS